MRARKAEPIAARLNSVLLLGRVVTAPRAFLAEDGGLACDFDVDVTERSRDRAPETPLRVRARVRHGLAQLCEQQLSVGREVFICGRLEQVAPRLRGRGNGPALRVEVRSVQFIGKGGRS